MSTIVWTYWEGPKPPYIESCLNSLRRVNGERLEVLDPTTLEGTLDLDLLHPNWKHVPVIASRVCCIRAALLYQYGGWWADADTVGIREWPNKVVGGFNYVQWARHRVINGYFGAIPGHSTVKRWLDSINHVLEHRFDEVGSWWLTLGEPLLTHAVILEGGRLLPQNTFLPFNFSNNPERFLRVGDYRDYVDVHTRGFALNNSWLLEHAKNELKPDGDLLINSLLRKARNND